MVATLLYDGCCILYGELVFKFLLQIIYLKFSNILPLELLWCTQAVLNTMVVQKSSFDFTWLMLHIKKFQTAKSVFL